MPVTNVVHHIRRNRQTIFSCLLRRRTLHHAQNALNNVINIGKVTSAIAIVENLDCFSCAKLIGETEIRHIRASGRSIHGKETQARRRNVIQL